MANLNNIRQLVRIKFIQKIFILSKGNLYKTQGGISASQLVAMLLIGGYSFII